MFWMMAGAAGCMAALLGLLPAAGDDQMWGLYAARLMLHGTPIYGPKLWEANPPMIFWLSMLPDWLAAVLHLPETAVAKAMVLGVGCAVGWVCLRMLRRMMNVDFLLPALVFVYVTVFAVMPARDLGQREHLLILLCLPYLLGAALDMLRLEQKAWARVAIGAAAGVGLALKPYQALIPVAVEIAILVWRRRFRLRVEAVVILLAGVGYVAAVRRVTPDYFSRIVPILKDTYWAFGRLGWWGLVQESVQLHVLALAVFALLIATGWWKAGAVEFVLLAAGVAATAAFYLQGTGWYYQQLPALACFSFALFFMIARLGWAVPAWAPRWVMGMAVLAVVLTTHFTGYPFTAERSFPIESPDPSFYAGLPPGTPVATLTTRVDATIPPLMKYHLVLAQRFEQLWMLPALLRNESPNGGRMHVIPPARLAALEQMQRAASVEDLRTWQPKLLLVERCQDAAVHCQVLEDRHDDVLAFYLRDAAFQAEFAHYRFWKKTGDFDGYIRTQPTGTID